MVQCSDTIFMLATLNPAIAILSFDILSPDIALSPCIIPVTLIFHHFWGIPAEQQQDQMIHFLKNVAIMGGLLILAYASPDKTEIRA